MQSAQEFSASIKDRHGPLEAMIKVAVRDRAHMADEQYRVARSLERAGNEIVAVYKHVPYVAALIDPQDAQQLANKIYGKPVDTYFRRLMVSGLERIVGIEQTHTMRIPPYTRERGQKLWHLDAMGVQEALGISQGKGARVGIIDTGCDYTHPEIAERFGGEKGIDLVDGGDPYDQNSHGTHVAGTVAGQTVGIARQSTLYAIRVLDENGSGSEAGVMAGIEWALDKGMHIVNLSLGSSGYTDAFEELCEAAYAQGMLICAAAGNDGGRYASYPAAFGEPVIAVAAIDPYLRPANFSNVYETNDIAGAGVAIYSSVPGGGYDTYNGTSMATPCVSGILALGIEINGTTDALEHTLYETAKELEFDHDTVGAGFAQAHAFARKLSHMNGLYGRMHRPGLLEKLFS